MNKDYIFHINWTDGQMQPHKIGILARIEDVFYLILKNEESAKTAYNSGYNGMPGFETDEVYTSKSELFDFFQMRVLADDPEKQCEELARTKGVSMVDSFSVEEISEKLSQKYKKIILEAYDLQLRKAKLEEKSVKIEESKEESSDELIDIE